MDGRGRVEIVELEALNEGAVEQGGGRCTGSAAPADDGFTPLTFELEHCLDRNTGPGQLSPDERAADTVEEEVFGSFQDGRRNVVGL